MKCGRNVLCQGFLDREACAVLADKDFEGWRAQNSESWVLLALELSVIMFILLVENIRGEVYHLDCNPMS